MIVTSERSLITPFFAAKLGIHASDDLRGILWIPDKYHGHVMKMEHVGVGIAYNCFVGRTAAIHIVVQDRTCFTRHVLRELFDYAFNTCGLNFLYAPVDSQNLSAVEFVPRVGFREVNRISQGGIDGDLIMFGMTKQECRWLKEIPNGQERSEST